MHIESYEIILIAIFLLVAFPVHEFFHAYAAYRLGDGTAKMFGRLTLNPIVHFDPLGGLLLVISVLSTGFMFGWAKPTPVNPSNLRDRRNSEVIVALAGPASNLVMACLAALVIRALNAVGVLETLPTLALDVLFYFVLFIVNNQDMFSHQGHPPHPFLVDEEKKWFPDQGCFPPRCGRHELS